MSAKAILVFCAQALFVQSTLSQCTSRAAVAADPSFIAPAGLAAPYGLAGPFAYDGLAAPYGYAAPAMAESYGLAAPGLAGPYDMAAPCAWATPAMDFTPTSGGALPVSSASAIPPVGISVISENVYEGVLAAAGEAPFVGTVAVEGVLPTVGASAVNHACGNGINAMTSGPASFTPAFADVIAPTTVAIAPAAAAIAPAAGFAPGFGYRAGWAGRGCGCGYAM